jgi:signal transduction histidine kinase
MARGRRAPPRLLEDRVRFETLLSDLFAGLIHVDASRLDAALENGLRHMVAFLGMDRGNLDEYIDGRPRMRVSWVEPGIAALPSILAAGQFPWTAEMLRNGRVVRLPRTDALPEEAAADRASYERLGTRSHLSIPLQAGGPMLGVLSFDSVRAERDWPDELVERLRLLSEAFASALERKRMESVLGERLRFQRLLSDLSARLANVSALDFDAAVHGALGAIRDFLGVERAELVEFSVHGGVGNSWSVLGTSDMTRVPWLMAKVHDGHVICVSRLEELPEIKSLLALPLRAAGVVLGSLVVATVVAERAWPNELIDQLQLIGEAMANAFAGVQAEREATRLRQHLAHIGRVSAMGELTASLAHELNQPLTAILNNAEVALQQLGSASMNVTALREILTDIAADDRRAAEVIHRLRALLRKGDLAQVPLDINDVVAEVAHLVRNDVVLRKVAMTVELAPSLPRIRGDRVQIQQVVLNMVLNGLEAMIEPNGRERALAIRTARAGETAVMVAVEDSGVGIDGNDVERMFEPLYTTKPEGLGMGLAIARSIVHAHGGELRASNNSAGGATFGFTLPVCGKPSP